jgi:hypothetical protein
LLVAAGQDRIVRLIRKAGGVVGYNSDGPNPAVVAVGFIRPGADPDAVLKLLSHLEQVETVKARFTDVTDAGLAHLAGVTSLRELDVLEVLPPVTGPRPR